MKLSLTVYPIVNKNVFFFFFSWKQLSYIFAVIFYSFLDVVLYVNLTEWWKIEQNVCKDFLSYRWQEAFFVLNGQYLPNRLFKKC